MKHYTKQPFLNKMKPLFLGITLMTLLASCSSKQFNLVVLPDTQTYAASYPEIFHAQTQWIADHADSVAFVLHEGDITNNNIPEHWQVAKESMNILDGKVPYILTMGNHDIGTRGSSNVRNTTLFNEYFPYKKHSRMPGFGGVFEQDKMDNSWYTYNAGGVKWLVLSLEFGPRNKVLDWAGKIIASHPERKVIILTHAYMYCDDTRMGKGDRWLPQGYGLGKKAVGDDQVNDGEQIWEKVASRYANVLFVFSGHVLSNGTGRLVSTGVHGNKVYQMLANYQSGVTGSEKGGNGFLRIVTMNTKKKTVNVKTYSPYLKTYKTEADQQFRYENVSF